jgi:ribosomal protein S18 acetylase RimI-like enzyme
VITYRSFRNWDPPALVRLWNASISSRGAAQCIEVSDLDRLVFSKPYFDPRGVTLAEDDGRAVGFIHAGFGANDEGQLSRDYGVIAMLVVAPSHRRHGIARELVRRAEEYLRAGGSSVIYAGSMHPLDPFYLGLYGGSELPGILKSDSTAHPFFISLGYKPVDECLVMQLPLNRALVLTDPRSRSWARRVDFVVNSDPTDRNWWVACKFSALDHSAFELRLRENSNVVARARAWEMYPLQRTWNAEAVGIIDVHVELQYRAQGLGSYLMAQVLKHYRDNGLTLAEIQTMARNQAACRLYRRLGFQEVDRGIIYRSESKTP